MSMSLISVRRDFSELPVLCLTKMCVLDRFAWHEVSVSGSEVPGTLCIKDAATAAHTFLAAGRWGHSAVIYQESMFLHAGLTEKGYVDDLWEFHFVRAVPVCSAKIVQRTYLLSVRVSQNSRSWSRVNVSGDVPSARHFHAATVVADSMYLFGGFGHKNMDDLHVFDFGASTQTSVGGVSGGGGRLISLALPDRHSAALSNSYWCLSLLCLASSRWKEIKSDSSAPVPRRGHRMVAATADLLVVFGGRAHTNLADVHIFSISSSTWHPLECAGKIPQPRHFHSACAYRTNVYVFGGIAGKIGSLNDLCRLSLGSWTDVSSPPSTPTSIPSNVLLSGSTGFRDSDAAASSDSIGAHPRSSSLSSMSPGTSRAALSGGSATKIRLKCQFAEEMRLIPVSKTIELNELMKIISDSAGLGSDAFLIQYKDEEGDLITIRTTEELHEAFDACEEEKQKFFRVFINTTGSPASSMRGSSSQIPPARRGSDAKDPNTSPPKRRSEDPAPSSPSAPFPARPSRVASVQHVTPSASPAKATDPPRQQMPVRYKLGTMLGRGAFGTVYLGLDEETGHLFAVKKIQIDPTQNNASAQLDRLQNEIRLLSRIQHPNIVQYLGSTIDKTTHHLLIFLEYVAGGSLMSMMSKFGPFKEQVVRQYCIQVMKGLELLHQRGIVHRDIKSANILVDSNGNIKVSDFGAATSIATVTMSQSHVVEVGESHLKSFAGTPYWMAPEVIRQNSYGRKCDVWALGCTLIELTTGKPPWSHLNPVTALFQIANEEEKPPTPPAQLSAHCQDFVARCLTRDAEQRPTINELMQHPWITEDIEFYVSELPAQPEPISAAEEESGSSTSSWGANISPNSTFPRGEASSDFGPLASNSFKGPKK